LDYESRRVNVVMEHVPAHGRKLEWLPRSPLAAALGSRVCRHMNDEADQAARSSLRLHMLEGSYTQWRSAVRASEKWEKELVGHVRVVARWYNEYIQTFAQAMPH
jgi:hypothetical protein